MISDESKLSSAVASLSMEGLTVTEEEIQLAKKCLCHEITYDDAVKFLVDRYSESSANQQNQQDNGFVTIVRLLAIFPSKRELGIGLVEGDLEFAEEPVPSEKRNK